MLAILQLSVAVAVPVAVGKVDPPQYTVREAGHVITGFSLSVTVTVKLLVVIWPLASVAV